MDKPGRRNIVREKSFAFAVKIVKFCRHLQMVRKEFVLSRQLLRSGTSIGANIEEALGAQSRKDFVARMSTAAQEARETHYRLRVLRESETVGESPFNDLLKECAELVSILNSIILTTRQNPDRNDRSPLRTSGNSEFIIQNSEFPSGEGGSHDYRNR